MGSNVEFNQLGLGVLGSLDEWQAIQYSMEKCHLLGPLEPNLLLMLQEACNRHYGQVLNTLEFPLGETVLKALPNHDSIASNKYSFDRTKNLMSELAMKQGRLQMPPYPDHALNWGLSPLCGSKVWVILWHRSPEHGNCNFYYDYIQMYFDQEEDIHLLFEAEVLYLDNSMHLLIGFIHMAMLTYNITNALQSEIKGLLFRIMINWAWNGTRFDQDARDPHMLDWMTHNGLLDVVALGAVILFAPALDLPNAIHSNSPVMLEWITARDTYVFAIAAFKACFATSGIEDIFLQAALHFGASLFDYLGKIPQKTGPDKSSIASQSVHIERALGDTFNFESAKNVLQWDVVEGYFKDTAYMETNDHDRRLFWEPDFTVVGK
ncbi:hypothetical protein IW262DRAFT_1297749 [Armillaria fumosa]|nr:hypothetical protein IW262DRAFT_1297749 [Armillaria fumosa]